MSADIFCENEPNFRSRRPVEFIDENGGGAGVRLRKPSEVQSEKKMIAGSRISQKRSRWA